MALLVPVCEPYTSLREDEGMNLTHHTTENEFRSAKSRLSGKQRFAIAAFPNWGELFQHLPRQDDEGMLNARPRGLMGLQFLWPPERRFDFHQLDELGAAASFALLNPRQTIFCSGDLVRSATSDLVAGGCSSLTDILEHWVAPIDAERLSTAVAKGQLLLWTSNGLEKAS
jgi:hypothetical protein